MPSSLNLVRMSDAMSGGIARMGRLRICSYSSRISSQTSGWIVPSNTRDSILDVDESGLCVFAAATNTLVSITA